MMITTHEINRQEDVSELVGRLREVGSAGDDVTGAVRAIIDDVASRGDTALLELTERFDGVSVDRGSIEVPVPECEAALEALDSPTRSALEKATGRIKAFAARTVPSDWTFEPAPGITVGRVSRPIGTVGIYVPGGRYPYPSTVLMTGIPARAAGVRELVLCVPPAADGSPHKATLAAASMLGDCRVFRAGGAQAIAAMAYGTQTIPRCDMIAGPGNRYVREAKRLVSDIVTVDLEAGPSEVVIYLDGSAEPHFAAADLLAQLEHDPLAVAVLISERSDVLQRVRGALDPEASTVDGTVSLVLSSGREVSLALMNAMAPEHLELMVEGAEALLPLVRSAGSVFLGPWSAVALGDYIAGPSHVLPTGGTARRLSGLSASDFTRTMNVIKYTREGLEADAADATALASAEGLGNHARSVEIRRTFEAPGVEV
jgi:histidinol dehydrogenase